VGLHDQHDGGFRGRTCEQGNHSTRSRRQLLQRTGNNFQRDNRPGQGHDRGLRLHRSEYDSHVCSG
jgi:hypothetical protein